MNISRILAPLLLLTRNFMTVCWWCSSDLWDPTDSAQLSNVVFYSRAHPLCPRDHEQHMSSAEPILPFNPLLSNNFFPLHQLFSWHTSNTSTRGLQFNIEYRSPNPRQSAQVSNPCVILQTMRPPRSCFPVDTLAGLGRVLYCGAHKETRVGSASIRHRHCMTAKSMQHQAML